MSWAEGFGNFLESGFGFIPLGDPGPGSSKHFNRPGQDVLGPGPILVYVV